MIKIVTTVWHAGVLAVTGRPSAAIEFSVEARIGHVSSGAMNVQALRREKKKKKKREKKKKKKKKT